MNDGAVGPRAGNGWEAQVHEVGLLPGTDTHGVGQLRGPYGAGKDQGPSRPVWLHRTPHQIPSQPLQTAPYRRNSSALSAAEISVTPPLGTCKQTGYQSSGRDFHLGFPPLGEGLLKASFSSRLHPNCSIYTTQLKFNKTNFQRLCPSAPQVEGFYWLSSYFNSAKIS